MKKTNIIYWAFTGLFAAFMLLSAIPYILGAPQVVASITKHLGYPAYFIPFIGLAKLLGIAALLIPGFPKIREWAYAGFVFDLTGALYSVIAVGDPPTAWIPPFACFVLAAGSYVFYQKKLKVMMP